MEEYKEFVRNLINHNTSYIDNDVNHMMLGIVGEVGELADALKQVVGYNQKLSMDNVIEELGDLLFYAVGMMDVLGISIEQVVETNMRKLRERYPDGFTEKDALGRKDKK